MQEFKVGNRIATAIAAGNSPAIVAVMMTIHHRGRLQRLFRLFAGRFLESFQDLQLQPQSRTALKRAERAKALLDLLRCRMALLGQRLPEDTQILEWARASELPRLVHRKAA